MRVYVAAAGSVLGEFVRRPLAAAGHEVQLYGDADSLLAACRADPPAAVVLGARLGGDRGHDLVQRLRRGGPMAAPLEVAAVILSPDEADRGDARRVSAAFLRVPFSASDLLDAVGAATRGRKLVLARRRLGRSSTVTPCPSSRRPATTWSAPSTAPRRSTSSTSASPIWSSPTSRCPSATATSCARRSRSAARPAPCHPCRSSSARRSARRPISSAASTPAPTTTWSSRSRPRS